MDIELPPDKGTYILLAHLSQTKRLEIGRLGAFDLIPGFYAYVGSAHGSGGLRARTQHHMGLTVKPRWHIDFLLPWAVPVEVWFAISDRKLEQDWAEFLEHSPKFGSHPQVWLFRLPAQPDDAPVFHQAPPVVLQVPATNGGAI